MIRSKICDLLGISYPIFQGGMAWVADGKLAAAVSEAGGFGVIAASQAPAETLAKELAVAKSLTQKPFGINIMMQSPYVKEVAELAAKSGVAAVLTGAGNPTPYIPMWKEAGVKVIPVIPSVKVAKKMAAAGADALVAEGMESGGHIGESATLPLVAQVTAAVDLPVLAAGGIADGRGLAAALMLGACGVQMGTAFLVAKECKISQAFKDRIIAADDTATVVTGRRAKHAVRSLANQLTAKYQEMEANCAPVEALEALAAGSLRRAVEENDMDMGGLMAGQIAGLVRQEASAAQIIAAIMQEAEALLLQAPALVED